jgi:hypothetical protein
VPRVLVWPWFGLVVYLWRVFVKEVLLDQFGHLVFVSLGVNLWIPGTTHNAGDAVHPVGHSRAEVVESAHIELLWTVDWKHNTGNSLLVEPVIFVEKFRSRSG